MNAYARMKRTMEILNLLVGIELIIVGALYLSIKDIPSAASWSIFGCMYIVMDKYSSLDQMSPRRQSVEQLKYGAAWLGLLLSTALLLCVAKDTLL